MLGIALLSFILGPGCSGQGGGSGTDTVESDQTDMVEVVERVKASLMKKDFKKCAPRIDTDTLQLPLLKPDLSFVLSARYPISLNWVSFKGYFDLLLTPPGYVSGLNVNSSFFFSRHFFCSTGDHLNSAHSSSYK